MSFFIVAKSRLLFAGGVDRESLQAYMRVYPARARGGAVIFENVTPEMQARLDAVLESPSKCAFITICSNLVNC